MTDGFTVLFIVTPSADPARADRLVKAIEAELVVKGLRADFDLQQSRASDVNTLTRELLSHLSKGNGIIHLCTRVDTGGFVFDDDIGTEVAPGALAEAFRLTCPSVQLIALSNCFAVGAAEALVRVPSPIMGTLDGTTEAVTRAFFVGVYRGFAFQDDIATAFSLGRNQVELGGLDPACCQLAMPADAAPTEEMPRSQAAQPTEDVVHNLRFRNPAFTGRDALIGAVGERLVSGDAVVAQAFEGMGGVGKSELAVEFAYRNLSAFSIVWWVACEEVDGIASELDQLAMRLGVPGETAGERLEQLESWLAAQGRWLLIADNVEDWRRVEPLLPRSGRGSLIITTREKGVHHDAIEVDVFTAEEAQQFVKRRLRQSDVEASALVEDLGRLPLALEQACSYILATGCSIDEYRVLYQQRHAELLSMGTTGGHEGTVTATFALGLERAKLLAEANDYAIDPEPFATLCAFFSGDKIPIRLLELLGDDDR